ncbi:MAG: amino acid dehydrogenase, partial [Alphaproteobacteria bacterium]|nr:amino acid dehydrogenase [Alphaproteobacteria bacterium]
MGVFEAADFDHHETVAHFEDKASGLKAIIAIHSTALGPACGGTRMYPYVSSDAALTDVLRLSRGMSYKSAMAGLPLGGGKAVIMGHPDRDKTDAKLLAYAEAVNALGGRYITAMDVGIGPKDLPVIARGTKHAAGYDQPGKPGGDSGPMTTLGTYLGLKAGVKHRLGTDTVKGLTVAVQGLG